MKLRNISGGLLRRIMLSPQFMRPQLTSTQLTSSQLTPPTFICRQQGIGLLELLISMLIGLFIMAGVLQMFSTSSQNSVAVAGASRIQENIRYVFSRLQSDIGQSGSFACINAARNGGSNFNPNDFDGYFINNMLGQQTAYGERFDFTTLVSGELADAATLPLGRIVPGKDTLHLRYVDSKARIDLRAPTASSSSFILVDANDPDFARLEVGDLAYLGDCFKASVFVITSINPNGTIGFASGNGNSLGGRQFNRHSGIQGSGSPFIANNEFASREASAFAYLYGGNTGAYQYFIGNTTGQSCADDAIQNCALFRSDNANPNGLEIAQGVHDMSVRYGWTDEEGSYRLASVEGLPRSSAFPGQPDWSMVDRLEVTLNFNSIDYAIVSGNQVDREQTGLLQKQVTRTFNLSNQL